MVDACLFWKAIPNTAIGIVETTGLNGPERDAILVLLLFQWSFTGNKRNNTLRKSIFSSENGNGYTKNIIFIQMFFNVVAEPL